MRDYRANGLINDSLFRTDPVWTIVVLAKGKTIQKVRKLEGVVGHG